MTVQKLGLADLSQAASDFAVANTPLFLLRKLRVNPVVAEIAQLANGNTILNALHTLLTRRPRSLRGAVKPYVLLVALSMKADTSHLQRASKFKSPHHDWYAYLCQVLLNAARPTAVSTIQLPSVPKLKNVKTKGLSVTQF